MEKFKITKEKFAEVRNKPDFIDVVDLGRLSNSLTFCFQTYLDYSDTDSAVGMRQKFRAFFFMIGLLREGLKKAEALQNEHQGQKFFDNGFGKLLQDTKTQDFKKWIERIRHQTVFHFDRKLVEKSLKNNDFELDEYVIFSADSRVGGHLYFNLSDELDFFYHLSRRESPKDKAETARKTFSEVGSYVQKFSEYSDLFISGVLEKIID